MTWEEKEKRNITLQELWGVEAFRASFPIKADYDDLRCPKPFSQRPHIETHPSGLPEQASPGLLCLAAPPGSEVFCRSAGRVTDECQRPSTHVSSHWQATLFVLACLTTSRPDARQWSGAYYWMLLVGLNQNLCFPTEIVSTNVQPDVAQLGHL